MHLISDAPRTLLLKALSSLVRVIIIIMIAIPKRHPRPELCQVISQSRSEWVIHRLRRERVINPSRSEWVTAGSCCSSPRPPARISSREYRLQLYPPKLSPDACCAMYHPTPLLCDVLYLPTPLLHDTRIPAISYALPTIYPVLTRDLPLLLDLFDSRGRPAPYYQPQDWYAASAGTAEPRLVLGLFRCATPGTNMEYGAMS
eukprot:3456169-Rhodomonas_salina.13